MVEAKKSLAPPTPPPQIISEVVMEEDILKEKDEGEWQEVGPKNKSTITRKIDYIESPISEIFGGKFHSALHRHGMKVSATVEPFFSLQLDIQSDEVHSLKNALELLAHKEAISLSDKDSIGATRRTTLLHLPPVLILHIKRFLFDGVKCRKLHKSITFDQDLEIPKDLLAPSVKGKLTYSQRSYRLWAVISHSGDTPDGGHYICESYHPPINGWLRHDDNYVKPVPPEQVFHSPHRSPYRVPYLFFYRQVDAVSGHRC
jgi:ubiquitin carboxyl-terminal hydrolase 10